MVSTYRVPPVVLTIGVLKHPLERTPHLLCACYYLVPIATGSSSPSRAHVLCTGSTPSSHALHPWCPSTPNAASSWSTYGSCTPSKTSGGLAKCLVGSY